MKSEIKKAFDSQKMICVKLKNNVDEFLIGFIEAFDEGGIVLFNIDYRGIANGHVYLNMNELEDILTKDSYIDKIKILWQINSKGQEFIPFMQKTGLKESFLEWLYNMHGLVRFIFQGEQLEGIICKIGKDIVIIEVIDKMSGEKDGYSVIRKEELTEILLLISE